MKKYVVTSNRKIEIRGLLGFKGESQTVEYDFTPWETDNGSVSSVEWIVESGQASISGESLSSGLASAVISTSESGSSLIKVTATAGSNVFVTHIRVVSKEPFVYDEDYGLYG